MLDSSEIPAFDCDTRAFGPTESLLQLHVHDADFSAQSIAAASDSLTLSQEVQYFASNDGYDSELSSIVSEPTMPLPDETDVALRPKKKTKKKKKSTSQRQKEELSYLRGKLFEYENELKRIARENKDVVAVAGAEANEAQTQTDSASEKPVASETDAIVMRVKSLSLWETMAKNQLEEKNRAELENAALKRKVEAQLKFAKSLERMLRKRRVSPLLQLSLQATHLSVLSLRVIACLFRSGTDFRSPHSIAL